MAKLGRRKFLGYSAATVGSSFFIKACAPDLTALDKPLDEALKDSPLGSPDSNPDGNPDGSSVDNPAGSDASPVSDIETPPEPVAESSDTIKVGLLHSLSGTLALSEAPLVEAELLAIEEINAAGGLLGKQLVPVQEDGASDWPTFAEKAEKLLTQHQVSVLFGGFTTASRKAILPVITAKNRLLWYPAPYEGQACSQNIFYGGAIANQQIEPAISWMLGNRGKDFFLVSANDRITHDIAKAVLKEKGGKIAGESFVPIENGRALDMSPVVSDIQQALPDGGIIFNSLVGDQNRIFFKALLSAGLSAEKYLVMSIRLSEEEVFQIRKSFVRGHYAAASYFQTIETPENKAWVKAFQDRYGVERTVGGAMETAYSMVRLWAQAVQKAGTVETSAVRTAAYGQTFQSPGGEITLNSNHHVSQKIYVGKVRDDGLFDILWESPEAIAPKPWSDRISSTQGLICDWSDPKKGEKYKPIIVTPQ